MPRPVEKEKRMLLARRAVQVMEREGVDVSMSRLAEELGVKRPTLLYHFPQRGLIVAAALEELLSEQATFVAQRIAAQEHPIDKLYAHVCAVHDFHFGKERRVVFLSQALASCGSVPFDVIVDIGNRVFAPHREGLVAAVAQGVQEGTVRPCDPDDLVRLTRSVIDGLLVQRVMTGCDLEPVHRLLWECLLAPLKTERTAE